MAGSNPTELPDGVPEDALDALYGLPLEEFTPGRDALAKKLQGDGKREQANWVKALKKPSAAAWVVNQLARTQKKDAGRVLDSGEALRAAQDRALAGEAGAGELGEASSEHASAMQALLTKAPGVLDGKGNAPSAATLERAAETLRAIPLDDEARAGFADGRLTRERQAAGLGFMPGADSPTPAKKRSRAEPKKPDPQLKARAKAAVEEAKAEHRARRDEVSELERDLRQTERKLERARAQEAEAKEQLDKAQAAAKRLK